MQAKVTGYSGALKFPQTKQHSLLNENLFVFIRLWSGPDCEQKVVDEVLRYLSAADADLEVTTPFGYIENLSSVANKVRVAILLANEVLLSENKDAYLQGVELAVCYKNQNEVSLASVGRFAFRADKKNKKFLVYEEGGLVDDLTLLPSNLLGLEKEPEIKCTSVSIKELEAIVVNSKYDQDTNWQAVINNFE